MDELMLDGNAVAGLLEHVFGVDATFASSTCAGCGAVEPLGAVRVFRSAGVVMRCAHCGDVLMTIVASSTETWIQPTGLRSLALRV